MNSNEKENAKTQKIVTQNYIQKPQNNKNNVVDKIEVDMA